MTRVGIAGAICAALCCFLSSVAPSAPIPNPCDQGPIPIAEWKGIDARHPPLHSPTLICVDPSGNVFILDQIQYRVLQFAPEGTYQKTWELPGDEFALMWRAMAASDSFLYASTYNRTYQFFPDGSVALWNFGSCMNGLAVDAEGNLIVSVRGGAGAGSLDDTIGRIPTGRDRKPPAFKGRLDVLPVTQRAGVWKLSSHGEILKHWDAPGWPIALGKDGDIYAVEPDSGFGCLRIHKDKIDLRECKLGLQGVGIHRGIAVSKNGNVFINDNTRVVEVDEKWSVLRRWCELGPAHDPLNAPRGLCVDRQENLYVVDLFKKRVLKFQLGGS